MFWNSLKAKAAEIIDSVGIYIENRIERDAQTLAAVGLFTLDRIRKDVGRALPAAGRQARRLLLATNSTYAERLLDATDETPFALPSERSLTDREVLDGYGDLYDELSTPADEIRQVVEAISDILAGRDRPDSSRGVRSFAPAGTARLAERQRRAYGARKKTVLRREREGAGKRLGRAAGAVSDATWELRREMQSDRGREAGYRTRGVRKALAAGAIKLLDAGREGGRRLLGGEGRVGMLDGDVGVAGDQPMEVVDVTPLEEEGIIQDVIEESNMEYAPDGLLSPQGFVEEKRRLISSLESCLSQPSETWLTQEAVARATANGVILDGTVLREVITGMVTLRDGFQKELAQLEAEPTSSDAGRLTMEYVGAELRQMKLMIDSVSSLAASAAGESAASLLKRELEGFVLSDSLDDIVEIELERMEQLLAERVAAREENLRSERKRQRDQRQRYRQNVVVEPEPFEERAFGDSVTVDRAATQTARSAQWNGGMFTEVEVLLSSPSSGVVEGAGRTAYGDGTTSGGAVEVVSDSEYADYERRFKPASGGVDEASVAEADERKDNPAVDLALRALDVLFFVGEKVFLVLLPDLITGGARVSSRYERATNRGRGSVGWKPLRNLKTKNIQ
ncbi:hypothetical protein ACHAWF_005058 [Thalassiosira exigua]